MAGHLHDPPAADRMKIVTLVLRVSLASVFLYSGLIKASSSAQFALALAPFTFLPENWHGPLAVLLPVLEIAGGLLILAPWTRRLGALTILGLCLLFITALGWALANDIIVSCSCFGEDETPSAGKMIFALVRDALFAVLALVVFLEKPLMRLSEKGFSLGKVRRNL